MMGKISLHPHVLLGFDEARVHRTKLPRRATRLSFGP